MRIILILGAGSSSSSLIQYLLKQSFEERLYLVVGDVNLESAKDKIHNHPNAKAVTLDVFNKLERRKAIQNSNLVISMLPSHLHIEIARDCLDLNKHLVTASYVSDAMQELHSLAQKKNLIFMNEIGLDPGIDHMSAMKVINDIQSNGGKIDRFESYCGGLIAPESDTNLWNYKFTWAPRNVVLAGQNETAKFMNDGRKQQISYKDLFRKIKSLEIPRYGKFEAYSNRDSLKYLDIYGLCDIEYFYRGTIRREGFCQSWDVFVQLGMTQDNYILKDSEQLSNLEFLNSFLPNSPLDSVEIKLRKYLNIDIDHPIWCKLQELDLFNPNKKMGLKNATPAQILEKILKESWSLQPNDKDMIVMLHQLQYEINGQRKQLSSSMVCLGDNQIYTAMSKTVGLPIAMVALLILNGKINKLGVQLPIREEVYLPILKELEQYGVVFQEETLVLPCLN